MLQYLRHLVVKVGKSQKMQEEHLTSVLQKKNHFLVLVRSVAWNSNFTLFFIKIPNFLPSSIFQTLSDSEPKIILIVSIPLTTRCVYYIFSISREVCLFGGAPIRGSALIKNFIDKALHLNCVESVQW